MSFNAHDRPPEPMRQLFKKWQKSPVQVINDSDDIIDFARSENRTEFHVRAVDGLPHHELAHVFADFLSKDMATCADVSYSTISQKYEVKSLPGLFIYPSLVPADVQSMLLDRLLHRDLSNEKHKSNLHLHYHIPYPHGNFASGATPVNKSFFMADPAEVLSPKDPVVHKPLTIRQMLERKLRWVTLGGQYDWTAKVYPPGNAPQFPKDIADLLKGLFPEVDAQAAIVNLYTPGDTLSVHRDVSEECDQGLISLSIGCDGLFVVGNHDGSQTATVRLHSGDVVLMSGESRFAWHAVPRIIPGSCPVWLRNWPANEVEVSLSNWEGWIANKRINVNVRQMRT